jgi:SAM-dependent methyltransferase
VIVELGCSQGLLSLKLRGLSETFYGLDISASAVRKAWEHWKKATPSNQNTATPFVTQGRFVVASTTSLPFSPNSTDVIVCSDGLFGWELPQSMQKEVLQQCAQVLRPGGIIILTDYLHPRRFDELIRIVSESPLSILSVEYLYDRLWYQFESWFHLLESRRWVQAVLRNMAIARLLRSFGRFFGKHGSKHLCIVAKKS